MSSFVVDWGGEAAPIYNKNTYPVFTSIIIALSQSVKDGIIC
jgi:hypothetical protein